VRVGVAGGDGDVGGDVGGGVDGAALGDDLLLKGDLDGGEGVGIMDDEAGGVFGGGEDGVVAVVGDEKVVGDELFHSGRGDGPAGRMSGGGGRGVVVGEG
jgi:hypothetical protein